MEISLSTKFCESDLDEIHQKYWVNSFKESTNELITFDLGKTEWINTEEIAFLFSWIRELKHKRSDLTIKIILPSEYLFKTEDSERSRQRREKLNIFLLSVWGMLSKVLLYDSNFENIAEQYNKKASELREFGTHQVIPFTIIDSSYDIRQKVYVDSKHREFLKGELTDTKEPSFILSDKLINILKDNLCYSPFESKIISHVIQKELFINSVEHSNKNECYMATSLNNKWTNTDSSYFIDHFLKEKHPDTHDFYKDKNVIFEHIKKSTKSLTINEKGKIKDKREARLDNYNSDFKNLSYLEFTFLDYGVGIHKTLRDQYRNCDQTFLDERMSSNYKERGEDYQILEYAFLLESSKNPYSREIEYSELIPRGLYFVVDMVRRYKGLLIARSGRARITFDFSDRIYVESNGPEIVVTKDRIYQVKDAVIHGESPTYFHGSLISIVLPERQSEKLTRSSVRLDDKNLNTYIFNLSLYDPDHFPKEIFEPQQYHYLSIAFLYHQAMEALDDQKINEKNGVEEFIFKEINQKLTDLQGVNCVLFLDFEFLPERSNYLKILSYLANSPKINEYTKLVVTNLSKDEHKVLGQFKKLIVDEEVPFLFKAIPCIRINGSDRTSLTVEDIDWLGVRDSEDEILLTKLLLGSKDNFPFNHLKDSWLSEGNVTARFEDRIYSIFSNFKDLIAKFREVREGFAIKWLKEKVEDGVVRKDGKKREKPQIFLTARGSYQKQYLSLYETLHYKYITDFFAKNLLDKYVSHFLDLFETDASIIDREVVSKIGFNKIVVVTVTSQLIGVSLRNLIKNDDDYKFLRTGDQSGSLSNCPKLIRLASYFSFQSEKPFEDIVKGDRILIVNDVISTGSLVEKLIKGIEVKGATVSSIMSIADCRGKESGKDEVSSIFFDDKRESDILSVLSSIKHDIQIRKFRNNPIPSAQIKRINPVLNKVVELNTRHSEIDRVLYPDPAKFMGEDFFNSNFLRIGHYQQNLTHNSYFTDMQSLFRFPNGRSLLSAVKKKIEDKNAQLEFNEYNDLKLRLNNFQNNYCQPNITDEKNGSSLRLKEALSEVIEILDKENSGLKSENRYKPDFIVHPVFSGIEEVSDEVFQDVFGTDRDNIISLQRYDTNNGWRFPFPAKRFNKITKGKHVLILDSGSLSGHSLTQLVDTISFLEVKRIDFVSVVGRIDDFQREFQSRLRNIKVKPLKSKKDSVIPLNVLFGINLHVPPFRSSNECPFCKEIEFLERISQEKITPHAKAYIEDRIQNEIILIKDTSSEFIPGYLPMYNGRVDTIPILEMRDKLGKVESYRFYEDYFTDFDSLAEYTPEMVIAQRNTIRKLELILICTLHEPKLHDTLRDLLSNVYSLIDSLLNYLIKKSNANKILHYEWTNYSLLRLYRLFKGNKIFTIDEICEILRFSGEDQKCLNFISYIFLEPFYNKSSVQFRNNSTLLLIELTKLIDQDDKRIINKDGVRDLVSELLMIHEPVKKDATVLQALMNLNLFFHTNYAPQHYKLLKQDISTLSILIDNPEKDKEDIIVRAKSINKRIKQNVLENLNTIKKSKVYKGIPDEIRRYVFEDEQSVSNLIKKLDRKCTDIQQDYSNSDYENDDKLFEEFEEFRRRLKHLQITHFTPQKDFKHFATSFGFDLREIIDNSINSSLIQDQLKERSDFIFSNLVSKDIHVEGSKPLMMYAFNEIFLNAVKRKKNDGATVSINLTGDNPDVRILTINQNKPWIKSSKAKEQGGYNLIFNSLVRGLYGDDAVEEIKGEDYFTIKIKLKSTSLTNGKS